MSRRKITRGSCSGVDVAYFIISFFFTINVLAFAQNEDGEKMASDFSNDDNDNSAGNNFAIPNRFVSFISVI